MQIKFIKYGENHESAVVCFVDEHLTLPRFLTNSNENVQKHMSADISFEGKFGQFVVINSPTFIDTNLLILVGIGKADHLKDTCFLNLGGKITDKLNSMKLSSAEVVIDMNKIQDIEKIANLIALGVSLKNYSFNKYFVAKSLEHTLPLKELSFSCDHNIEYNNHALVDGINLTRDLVSEPPSTLYPQTFADRCLDLEKLGVKVSIFDSEKLDEMGMNAIITVGKGSARSPHMVVMEYKGDESSDECIAFIGKGVTFDSGGISLKPSANMADMKYDMAGAGAVTGLMHTLSARKAKVNVICAIGLAENMPSSTAVKPSDIIMTKSGQTIEVDNTDAEGRLVLSDVLWHVNEQYKPKLMVDLATLTGAIVVALGDGHVGLFSNDDKLAQQLLDAGNKTGEYLWRMPLSDHYDKQINSEIADVKNTGAGKGAGSITAAHFLKRFVGDTPWAHLDIAGLAWNKKGTEALAKGATGFGVRLLNQFILDNFESR